MEIERLVFSGGGMKGLLYVGCLRALRELDNKKVIDLNLKEICGVSVGSIMALLYVIGYTYEELYKEVMVKDFKRLIKIELLNLYEYGIDKGENVITWLESLLLRKINKTRKITLKQLYDLTGVTLNIAATNLTKYTLDEFNWKSDPDLEVLRAIRMSIGVPFLFTKQYYKDCIYVDGGVTMTYPIKLYEVNELSKTIGFRFKYEPEEEIELYRRESMNLETYIYKVTHCYMYHKTKDEKLSQEYLDCTLTFLSRISTLTFNIDQDRKKSLVDDGYNQTILLLKNKCKDHKKEHKKEKVE